MATVEALLEVTILPASASTKVYVVPVWALIAYITPSKGIVQFVKVPDVGVPNIGVTIVILVEVQFDILPLVGVPKTGVTKVGDVKVPVALVNTNADGVPRAGVTNV